MAAENQIDRVEAYRYVVIDRLNESFSNIQDAINASESNDIINVSAGSYIENININKSLTMNGAGADVTIVDGNQAGSVLTIGDANVTILNMSIRGGASLNLGGGIINTGRLMMTNCRVSENRAEYGGGIHNSGSVILIDSIISKNSARSDGGGIHGIIDSQLTIQGSSDISGNTAKSGGGIANFGRLKLDGSKISGNTAYSNGGGILNVATMTMAGSTVSGNSAAAGWGGGIANFGMAKDGSYVPADAVITSSLISGNRAAQFGGGIASDGKALISGSTVKENNAAWGGGVYVDGFTTMRDNTISGNIATQYGGGILNDRELNLTGGIISGNRANTYGGGGIANYGDMVNSAGKVDYSGIDTTYRRAILTASNLIIWDNTAVNNGGGIASDGIVTIIGSTITGNKAPKGAGVYNDGLMNMTGDNVFGNNAYGAGGGIRNDDTITINDGTIYGNVANTNGGGLHNFGTLFIGGTTRITNNQATTGYGGGIYSYSGPVTFAGTNVSVKDNKAQLGSSNSSWYLGWNVYSYIGVPQIKVGFSPAKQVTGNVHI